MNNRYDQKLQVNDVLILMTKISTRVLFMYSKCGLCEALNKVRETDIH